MSCTGGRDIDGIPLGHCLGFLRGRVGWHGVVVNMTIGRTVRWADVARATWVR